jgi:hypothetical protein
VWSDIVWPERSWEIEPAKKGVEGGDKGARGGGLGQLLHKITLG